MRIAPQADDLEPALAQREVIIAAQLIFPRSFLLMKHAEAGREHGAVAIRPFVRIHMVNLVEGVEIGRRSAIRHILEPDAQLGLLDEHVQPFFASVDDIAIGVGDDFRPGIPVDPAHIGHAEGHVDIADRTVQRKVAIGQPRRQPVAPSLRIPGECSGQFVGRCDDDVRHLPRQAGDIQGRPVDNVDARHIGCGDAAKLGDDVVRLSGKALAIDKNVGARLTQSAPSFLILTNDEAGDAVDHVGGGTGREAGEVRCRIAARGLAPGRGRDSRRRGGIAARLCPGRCRDQKACGDADSGTHCQISGRMPPAARHLQAFCIGPIEHAMLHM